MCLNVMFDSLSSSITSISNTVITFIIYDKKNVVKQYLLHSYLVELHTTQIFSLSPVVRDNEIKLYLTVSFCLYKDMIFLYIF
jgi:hypothetical protein